MHAPALPETGFVRLRQIVGDRNADPPRLGLIPIGPSSWWEGVKSGRYPPSVKLGPRITAWRVEDIRALIERLGREAEGEAEKWGRPHPRSASYEAALDDVDIRRSASYIGRTIRRHRFDVR